jgi:serine/threonine protein kinase
MQRQFLWEARVAAHLDHPNIVPVHDIGLGADGGIFFTMKLVDGESLEDALAKVARNDDAALLRFALPRRLRIFVQVAQAVAFAHARGVLHRDLKPANVMLGPHGEVYVTDWGIAVLGGDASPPARLAGAAPQAARGVSGTPKYMSPEQAAGEPLDVPSDIYSLGAMLFETIALAPAIEGHSVTDVIERVKRGERKPLGEVCPDVSSSLAAIVERAMALDPRDRYGNVQELIIDVERVLDGLTPSAEKASLVTRAWRSYQARDHALSQLRVMDVDFMVGSGWFVGMAMGLWAARFVPEWTAWIALAGAVAIGVPPTRRWLRARKRGATL